MRLRQLLGVKWDSARSVMEDIQDAAEEIERLRAELEALRAVPAGDAPERGAVRQMLHLMRRLRPMISHIEKVRQAAFSSGQKRYATEGGGELQVVSLKFAILLAQQVEELERELAEARRACCPGNGDDPEPVRCQVFEASEQAQPCPPGCCVMAEEKDVRAVLAAIEHEEGSVPSASAAVGAVPIRRCTCYVLPHADDCEIFIGITQSGELVAERRSGVDRRSSTSSIELIAHPDKEADLFLCCADGEGTHEFRICRGEEGILKFYEEMCGRDADGTLDSLKRTLADPEEWRNDGTALDIELYCARFFVWKVSTAEVAMPSVPKGPSQGKLIEMGEIKSVDLDGTVNTYPMALLITFDSKEEIRKAIKEGVCRFVFP